MKKKNMKKKLEEKEVYEAKHGFEDLWKLLTSKELESKCEEAFKTIPDDIWDIWSFPLLADIIGEDINKSLDETYDLLNGGNIMDGFRMAHALAIDGVTAGVLICAKIAMMSKSEKLKRGFDSNGQKYGEKICGRLLLYGIDVSSSNTLIIGLFSYISGMLNELPPLVRVDLSGNQ